MHQHPHHQSKHNEHWQQQQQLQSNTNSNANAAATCTAEYSLPFNQLDQQQQQPLPPPPSQQRHQHMPRKQSQHGHSHSPHPSRHTSPHSRHTSPHSRHTSPHSRHTSPHSRHTSPHSRHTSPHSRHTSPHSRHTSPHSRHTSPHGHGHSHGHSHSHSSPHQSSHHHHDMHEQHPTNGAVEPVEPFVRNSVLRASVRSTASHVHTHNHSHHHHRRRKRVVTHTHSNNSGDNPENAGATNGVLHHHNDAEGRSTTSHQTHSTHACARRHRSVTDLSNASLNTCNDPTCTDREVQEIFVHKSSACCTGSRPELAQYFAEDLYGSSSRRPSSCCTSSDYCYQTDSTSLYGSRSSLSRNNSVKSASVTMRKKKISQQRQPSYHSISLRALNDSRPNSQTGSLASIFDRAKHYAENGEKLHGSSSKVTIQRHTSKDALSNDLPEYACSPSPIRWSFLADGKASADSTVTTSTTTHNKNGSNIHLESELKREIRQSQPEKSVHQQQQLLQQQQQQHRQQPRKPQRAHKPLPPTPAEHSEHPHRSRSNLRKPRPSDDKPSTSHKCCESPCKYEESTVVQFHHVAETFNNCCNNYIQCNTYLDQDLQITSEDIHQYLSKGQQDSGSILNNTKTYPFQPSNALEFQYKNNFANNNTATNTLSSVEGAESMHSYDSRFRRNSSKETNLNQNSSGTEACAGGAACTAASCSSAASLASQANINLSSSTNNINIVFSSSAERNANEVKFINTTSRHSSAVVTSEAHHSSYLPYTYPTYDYTNMSANSAFDKPLGIDEIPGDLVRGDDLAGTGTSSSQHSSSLHSPEPRGLSFESFDASSGHNLLATSSSSHRGSCQFSPTTPRSPISPDSPTASSASYSASINPSTTSYVHLQPHHPHYDYPPGIQQQRQSHVHAHTHSHSHHLHHDDYHLRESFKISSALKKVRKRARKYTDFLRKK